MRPLPAAGATLGQNIAMWRIEDMRRLIGRGSMQPGWMWVFAKSHES